MANIIPLESIYDGPAITTLTQKICFFRIHAPGTLIAIYLWVTSLTGGGQPSLYNVLVNGVQLWSGGNRLQIKSNTLSQIRTGLTLPVTTGDLVQLDLQQMGGALSHNGPIVLLGRIQES